MKLNFPHLKNPHKIKKNRETMKRWLKIAVWTMIAVTGAVITNTNPLWWLVAVVAGRTVLQLILTLALGVILYVLFYALIIGGLFWVLIS